LAGQVGNLDIEWVRQQFPSLKQTVGGQQAVFFDAPGGTQVPQRVIDAVANYLSTSNANTCGAFLTSARTDQLIADARAAMADFLNCDADEVVFGPNMTTLTLALSRAIGRELKSGDELLVTCLDHDANVSPWVSLEERGAKVRTADIKPGDCTLDMFDLSAKIRRSTRVVAVGWAANAVGTINDVGEAVRLAHA
jgi:selenocysteine lyase/cysteine desulfurase